MEIQPLQIIFQIINFSVILGLLSYLLYKPILKVFEERSKRIEEGQKAARDLIEEKAAIEALKLKTQKKLESEETKKLEQITTQVKEKKQELLAVAQEEVTKFVKGEEQKWQVEKQRRITSLKDELVSSIITASEKVIDKKLTDTDKKNLVNEQLDIVLARL
ncbi:MAG TPA: ATP synthase F0 subunit B [Candidatus Woesebacteria bacterium]|nr:ATP synthase F0 subunit B [Candidatus Woesebacteria bacterium]